MVTLATGEAQRNVTMGVHKADGSLTWITISSAPVVGPDDTIDGVVVTFTDITDLKQTQLQFQRSRERFQRVSETAHDAIITCDLNGHIAQWNRSAEKMFGYEREAVLGEHINIILPDNLIPTHNAAIEAYQSEYQTRSPGHVLETTAQHQTGHIVPVEVSLSSWSIEDEVFLTAIIRDITQRRMAEKHRLAVEIERQKSDVLASFIQDASHEFRSPLSVIMTNTFLLDKLEDPERLNSKKRQIKESVREISTLLESILIMVELDYGTLHNISTVDVNSIVRSVTVDLHHEFDKRHQTLNMALAPDMPTVHGSDHKLFHALFHLIHNASRFTQEGGTITLTTAAHTDHIIITVQDDGPGMSKNIQKHMFQRFWRYDRAHTTSGFGLGLPIAKKAIELHGGLLTYDTSQGQGTTFTVQLPV